ncbi:MAG: hypothetical protein OHK93_002755 [Ramalina farinacea]|uniref:DUF7702 domain-containing protein n=1 Tax=Ramalina farinacea TaxID=258253 RepID=A0AA43QUM6_9LECA|nr:hypothetical protein [Ramalina farinacea]
MAIGSREGVAIGEIAVYTPLILAAVFVAFRQSFFKQIGWVYVVVFCGLRLASGALGVLSANNPKSTSDAAWTAILGSIGLSPLLLACLGCLKRVNDFLRPRSFIILALRLVHIPCLIALILGIIGGTDLEHPDEQDKGYKYLKASAIIFLLTYLATLALALLTIPEFSRLRRGELGIMLAVLASLPFLAVRVLYSLLADFKHDSTFNIIDGNVWVQLAMALIMELIVAIMYILAGGAAERFEDLKRSQSIEMSGGKGSGNAYAPQQWPQGQQAPPAPQYNV